MNTKTLLLVIIIGAVLTAGCIQIEPPEKQVEDVTEEIQEVETPEETEPEPEPEEELLGTECSEDADCKDDDYCTTDACIEGECFNNLITGCRQKKESEPLITAVSFGGDDDWLEIKAYNYRVDEWTIENKEGKVFHTFAEFTTLNNIIKIHEGSGFSTEIDWYMSKGDFWKAGDTAYLKDADGEVVSQIKG